jgi:hypothetical protein
VVRRDTQRFHSSSIAERQWSCITGGDESPGRSNAFDPFMGQPLSARNGFGQPPSALGRLGSTRERGGGLFVGSAGS